MKYNLTQLAIEQETTPGTAETPAAANVVVKVREGFVFEPEVESVVIDTVSDVDSKDGSVPTRLTQRIDVGYPLIGPGDLVTPPAIAPFFEAAMFNGADALAATVDVVVSGGPFLAGEIITGSVSSDTGMVLQDAANGATVVYYVPVVGDLVDDDIITGSTSGATATINGAPADHGYAFRPASIEDYTAQAHHCTLWGIIGGGTGKAYKARSCLADLNLEFTDGGPCWASQTFLGAHIGVADQATFTLSNGYPEATNVIPQHKNNGMLWNYITPVIVGAVSVSIPTGITLLTDTTTGSSSGILYANYAKSAPTVSFQMGQVPVATYDWEADAAAMAKRSFEFTLGSTEGLKWRVAAPAAQITSLTPIDIEGIAGYQVELQLCGSGVGNNEILIHQI